MSPLSTRRMTSSAGALVACLLGASCGSHGPRQAPSLGSSTAATDCQQPLTCADLPSQCGTLGDNCGGTIDCSCPAGLTCTNGLCSCVPTTCTGLQATCGTLADGCGGTIFCGDVSGKGLGGCSNAGDYCVGSGPATCVPLPADAGAACQPQACAPDECGVISDGCGGSVSCSPCAAGQLCDQATNQCVACSGGDCGPMRPTSCEADTYTVDCPELSCQTATGCVNNVCQYAPVTCAGSDGLSCPVTTCDPSPWTDTYGTEHYANLCVDAPAAPCTPPGGAAACSNYQCVGTQCVVQPCGTCGLGTWSCDSAGGPNVCVDIAVPGLTLPTTQDQCDGVGAASPFLFVDAAATGPWTPDGSRYLPYTSVSTALNNAATGPTGAHPNTQAIILAGESSTYNETGIVTLKEGVSLLGGFVGWPSFAGQNQYYTTIQGGGFSAIGGLVGNAFVGLWAEDITKPTVVYGIWVNTNPAPSTPTSPATSNIAIGARNAPGLMLQVVGANAGAGGPGADGSAGAAGAAGGSAPQVDFTGDRSVVNPGGTSPSCPVTEAGLVTDGAGSGQAINGAEYGVINQSGAWYGGSGGSGGWGACGGIANSGAAGLPGDNGLGGGGGGAGSGGPGTGGGEVCMGTSLELFGGTSFPTYEIAFGGGGGAGGCGGTGGGGGAWGGYSIPIYLETSSGVMLSNVICDSGTGGTGGNGGAGGAAGAGGLGSEGPVGEESSDGTTWYPVNQVVEDGYQWTNCMGSGFEGGPGGSGGAGGGGGGGGGGNSVGVYSVGTTVNLSGVVMNLGSGGAGGAGAGCTGATGSSLPLVQYSSSGASTTFPTSLPGLLVWLDARYSQLTMGGGSYSDQIQQWTDLSGNGNNAVWLDTAPAPGVDAITGAVSFDGRSDVLTFAQDFLPTTFTILAEVDEGTQSSSSPVFFADYGAYVGSNYPYFGMNDKSAAERDATGAKRSVTDAPVTGHNVRVVSFDASSGVLVSTTTHTTSAGTPVTSSGTFATSTIWSNGQLPSLGCQFNAVTSNTPISTSYWAGEVLSFVVYDRVLSDQEVQSLLPYLNQ